MSVAEKKPVKRNVRQDYSLAEVQRGLTAVAYANGNRNQAERDLTEAGQRIPSTTLREWVNGEYRE